MVMRKISFLMTVIMISSLFVSYIPVQADTIATIFPALEGYTAMQSGTVNWIDNENLYIDGRPGTERVVFLKFEIPEFQGKVTSATLRLRSKEAASVVANDKIVIYRVVDSAWDSTSAKPSYANGSFTPYIDPTPGASYVFVTDGMATGKNYDIDIKDMIKQPGTYSLAMRTTAACALRFYPKDDASYGSTHGARIINFTYDSSTPRGDVSTIVEAPTFLPTDDGFYTKDKATPKWYNDAGLTIRSSSSGVPTRVSYLKFTIPQYVKNIKEINLNMTSSTDTTTEHKVSAYGVLDTSWAEIENGSVVTPSSTDDPALSSPLDYVILNSPVKDTTFSLNVSDMVRKAGTYAIAVTNSYITALDMYSKDSTAIPSKKPNIKIKFDIDAAESNASEFSIKKNVISSDSKGQEILTSLDGVNDGTSIYNIVKLVNDTENPVETNVILAEYNSSNNLIGCELTTLNLPSYWYHNTFIEKIKSSGVTKIKSFVWGELSSMKPIDDGYTEAVSTVE